MDSNGLLQKAIVRLGYAGGVVRLGAGAAVQQSSALPPYRMCGLAGCHSHGPRHNVDISTNLRSWSALLLNFTGEAEFYDALDRPTKFYRVIEN